MRFICIRDTCSRRPVCYNFGYLPADQKIELTLSAGVTRTCNLPAVGGACTP
jgi:hypothetical protein